MNPNSQNFLKKMQPRDFEALHSIYVYRCLSYEQIYELNYKQSKHRKGEVSDDYFKKKFAKFKEYGMVEGAFTYDRSIPELFFLTNAGVKVVKEVFDMPDNIYDSEKHVHQRGYLTAGELRVEYKFMPHQYRLNCFAIRLASTIKFENYHYEDERHMTYFSSIRPDGLFCLSNMDIFLEMDMGTETTRQLEEKWFNYRAFSTSTEFIIKEKPITIMFIVENVKRVEKRMALIKDSINKAFIDVVTPDFNLYVGTSDMLIEVFEKKIVKYLGEKSDNNIELGRALNKKFGFGISEGKNAARFFDGTSFMWYIRKSTSDGVQEFVVDDMRGQSIACMSKIRMWAQRQAIYKANTGRDIRYICLVDNPASIRTDLSLFGLLGFANVLFTTEEFLESANEFNEALFTFINDAKEFYKFSDNTLKKVYAQPL